LQDYDSFKALRVVHSGKRESGGTNALIKIQRFMAAAIFVAEAQA